ncbi:hypothetical protein [uncultured Fibrella sp.]|uniref:hypothetical protein n=1 Tax=uncultured Fibrella sp. TaxID=1284596 RepID=UPI0035CC0FA8
MEKAINVSMLSMNWQQMTQSLTDRIALIGEMCSETFMTSLIDPHTLHIVVVPEYFFRKSPIQVVSTLAETYHGYRGPTVAEKMITQAHLNQFRGVKRKHTMYSPQERDLLVASLSALSANNVLIVAGTMFWVEREPVIRPAGFCRAEQITKGTARNTCYLFHNGAQIGAYHKIQNSHELDSPEDRLFTFMGGTTVTTCTVDGLRVGVEICADHNAGTMANQNLDIHIIVSDGMAPFGPNVGTRANGVVLCCDSMNSHIAVYNRNATGQNIRTVAAPLARRIKKSVLIDTNTAPLLI